jgi:hypothetical protein
MKNLAILILLCIPLLGLSQNVKQPKYFLNSEAYNMDSVFLNFNKIDSLWVKKDIPGGEIFIRTKSQPWEYYSLYDFLKRTPQYSQIIDKSIIPVFIINGKVINKKSDAKIDKSYYAKVNLGSLSNVSGLPAKSKKIVIVNIELTDKDPSKDIHIRGDSIPKLDN